MKKLVFAFTVALPVLASASAALGMSPQEMQARMDSGRCPSDRTEYQTLSVDQVCGTEHACHKNAPPGYQFDLTCIKNRNDCKVPLEHQNAIVLNYKYFIRSCANSASQKRQAVPHSPRGTGYAAGSPGTATTSPHNSASVPPLEAGQTEAERIYRDLNPNLSNMLSQQQDKAQNANSINAAQKRDIEAAISNNEERQSSQFWRAVEADKQRREKIRRELEGEARESDAAMINSMMQGVGAVSAGIGNVGIGTTRPHTYTQPRSTSSRCRRSPSAGAQAMREGC